jgi:hypothetical protein
MDVTTGAYTIYATKKGLIDIEGDLMGDVIGKVLGGSATAITGVGAYVQNESGNKVAEDSTVAKDATVSKEATLTAMKGTGWGTGTLQAIYNKVSANGSGANTYKYSVTNIEGGAPIPAALVVVTSDVDGLTRVAEAVTDNLGVATFFLDAGNYYFWVYKDGFTFNNPDYEAVP